MFANAKKWGHFGGENPALGVELPEKQASKKKQVLMPDQVARLLAILREPVRTMALIGVLTGLRVGEILGLRWQDVDFKQGELRVEQAVYRGSIGSPKTRGSMRILPLPDMLVSALKGLAIRSLEASPESLVFATRNGTPYSVYQSAVAGPETRREADRRTMAELAYFPADAPPFAAGGGIGERCAGSTWTCADQHNPRDLHHARRRTSTGSGRKAFRNGDEW